MAQANTVGDVLGMDFEEALSGLDFNFDEEQYDQYTRFERTIAFDILWDELDEYPRDIVENDPVLTGIEDDRDHRYTIKYGEDDVRETAVPGLVLFAWLDPDAEVTEVEIDE